MKSKKRRQVWTTPRLEQIEMIDTSNVTGGCMQTGTGSKTMAGDENLANNCSVGS